MLERPKVCIARTGVPQHCDTGQLRDDGPQQFDPFNCKLRRIHEDTGDVFAWPVIVLGIAGGDRVVSKVTRQYWNGVRCRISRAKRRCAISPDDIGLGFYEVGGEFSKARQVARRAANVELDILAFDPAQLGESTNDTLPTEPTDIRVLCSPVCEYPEPRELCLRPTMIRNHRCRREQRGDEKHPVMTSIIHNSIVAMSAFIFEHFSIKCVLRRV